MIFFNRYALVMWLPMYLTKGLGYSLIDAGWISSAFHLGGVLGSPVVGYLADKSTQKYVYYLYCNIIDLLDEMLISK